jgi:hypothetical protein
MEKEKLHPIAPLFFEALAKELLARTAALMRKSVAGVKNSQVSLEDCKQCWEKLDAHNVFEGHLPYLTPISFVDSVVISQLNFDTLDAARREQIKTTFGTKLILTPGRSSAKQYELATSHRPFRTPSLAFAVGGLKPIRVILPVAISDRSCRVIFRASAPQFRVLLGQDDPSPLSPAFAVDGDTCTAVMNGAVIASERHFNTNLRRAAATDIVYCVSYEPAQKSLVMTHSGDGSLFNNTCVTIKGIREQLMHVCFEVPAGCAVSFGDVRVVMADTKYVLDHERSWAWVEPAGQAKVARKDEVQESPPVRRQRKPNKAGVLQTFKNLFQRLLGKPICDQGVDCESYRKREGDGWKQTHEADCMHLCLYGATCAKAKDATHAANFIHLEKKPCPHEKCRLLSDADHRATFHHPLMWDVLMPCRFMAGCTTRHDERHCRQYHHDASLFYDLRKDSVICCRSDGASGEDEDSEVEDSAPPPRPAHGGAQGGPPRSVEQPPKKEFVWGKVDADEEGAAFMVNCYNQDALEGNYAKAQFDQYGNAIGGAFDLAKDGAFRGFQLLVGCFYQGENLPMSLESAVIPTLVPKGWETTTVTSVADFVKRLDGDTFHVAWVISSNEAVPDADAASLSRACRAFHQRGRGLMVWGDNDPYYTHANAVLGDLFGFTLTGDTPGGKELTPGDANAAGHFGRHMICAGIKERIHEGVTICYPTQVPASFEVFGTSSNGKPVFLATKQTHVTSEKCGRVVVDNGFTKLYTAYWSTAGNARYVNNCCAWLANRERFPLARSGFAKAK